MKSFTCCFSQSTIKSESLWSLQAGHCFGFTTAMTYYGGRVLHRHETSCGVLLLVRLDNQLPNTQPRAIWLSHCGNSGLIITRNHWTHRGVYIEADPDYKAAMEAYNAPVELVESNFQALGELL